MLGLCAFTVVAQVQSLDGELRSYKPCKAQPLKKSCINHFIAQLFKYISNSDSAMLLNILELDFWLCDIL